MLVYTTINSNRFNYIVSVFFNAWNIKNGRITQNVDEFTNYSGPKINYSTKQITKEELWIVPNGLLSATNITEQKIDVFEWNNLKVFFKTNGDIPFDFLAASFYLLTRYEEYLPHEQDMYGRYAHTNSIAFKYNFLHLPLINLWMQEIEKYFAPFSFHYSSFTFIPTYDIDIAYSYQNHNPLRNAYGFFRDFLKANFDSVAERLQVYTGTKKDPFDIYNWLNLVHQQYQLKPIYFFLLAAKRKGYDKNLSPKIKALQLLIQKHVQQYSVGIHPSWQSGDDDILLKDEIFTLQNIVQQTVKYSRQHYIRMSLPNTYQKLIEQGIEEEYSMGYGSINGFRASYTLPFKWYDLQKEEQTNLTIHPFCYMEANSFFEQKLTIDEAAAELQSYYNIVKKVNGHFITIFHNHFLTEQTQWIAWRNMYENFLHSNFANE